MTRLASTSDAASTAPLASTVGVVIPVYNRRTVIVETLDYVAAQSLAPAKVVVADDGSTDGTPDAVERWAVANSPAFELEVLRGRKASAAVARNAGFARVIDTPFVAFLDSDDHWPKDFLQRATQTLQMRPEAVAVSVDRRFFNRYGRLLERDSAAPLAADPIRWFFHRGAGVASSSVFRSQAVKEAGGWDEDLWTSEDSWLFSLIATLGPWLHAPGDPVSFYHGAAASRGEENQLSERRRDRYRHWAIAHDRLYYALRERSARTDWSAVDRAMALWWYRAGREAARSGQPAAARRFLMLSIAWNPFRPRTWWRLMRCMLHSKRADGKPAAVLRHSSAPTLMH